MTRPISPPLPRLKHPLAAYQFLFEALRFTQEKLGKVQSDTDEEDAAHISGQELLDGIREYARVEFGLMSKSVLDTWGIFETSDFGLMVYELIERGQMRKTDRDCLDDFCDRYDFEAAFGQDDSYDLDVSRAFQA
jgi:uncharacterized repeat protein (TIGR04138 family)